MCCCCIIVECWWRWGPFSDCSKRCEGGRSLGRERYPVITHPSMFGGRSCPDNVRNNKSDEMACHIEACSGQTTTHHFRENTIIIIQCVLYVHVCVVLCINMYVIIKTCLFTTCMSMCIQLLYSSVILYRQVMQGETECM